MVAISYGNINRLGYYPFGLISQREQMETPGMGTAGLASRSPIPFGVPMRRLDP